MAFEDMDAIETPIEAAIHDPEDLVENDIIELNEVTADTEATEASIDEASSVADTLDSINEKMQASIDQDGGLTPPVADALRVAVEHFQKHLGYKGKHVFPAMENFGGKMTKKAATQLAIEQNTAIVSSVRGAITVAQESLIDKLNYNFKLIFANEKKLLNRLNEVSSNYDKKGFSEAPLVKPSFSKFFNKSGKTHITSSDMLKSVTDYRKLLGNEDILKLVQRTDKAMSDLAIALKKTNFVADEKELQEIQNLILEVTEIEKSVNEAISEGRDFSDKVDVDPIKADDKKKLVSEINAILNDNNLEKAMKSLEESYYDAEDAAIYAVDGISDPNSLKNDVQLANKAIDKAYAIVLKVLSVSSANIEVCHASITYIAMSTNKN